MMLTRFATVGGKPLVYATLNPASKGVDVTLSNGNKTLTSPTWMGVVSTISKSSGKWYWEYTIGSGAVVNHMPSVANSTASTSTYFGADTNSKGWQCSGQVNYNNAVPQSFGGLSTVGDVIGIALDASTGSVDVYRNGTLLGTMAQSVTGPYFAGGAIYSSAVGTFNFGASAFSYGPPSGYNPGLYV